MRRRPYPITDLTGGMNIAKDPILILDKEGSLAVHTRYDKGLLRKDVGYFALGLPLLGIPLDFALFEKSDGGQYSLCMTTTTVYQYNATTKEWDDILPNLSVDPCETFWTYIGSNSASVTTDKKQGTYAADLVIDASHTTGLSHYHILTAKDLSTYTHIHLWIKSSIALAAGDIQLILDDTDPPASAYLETIDFPALAAGVWTRVSLELANPASDTAIISIGINVAVDKGACSLFLDDVKAVVEYTGTADDRYTHTTLLDYFIFTNGVDSIKKYDGTDITALGGSPPSTAKCVVAFQNRLILAYTEESAVTYPFRIRWSSAGTIETWSGGTSGYIDVLDTPDPCVHLALLRDKCFLYKADTSWEITYVGSTEVFLPIMKLSKLGLASSSSLCEMEGYHVIVGRENLSLFDGAMVQPYEQNILPYLYMAGDRLFDLTYVDRVSAIYVKELDEVWISLPTTGSSGVPDLFLKRNTLGGWSMREDDNVTCMAVMPMSPASAITWDSLTGTWDDLVGSWDSMALPAATKCVYLGTSSGQVYYDDRTGSSSSEMSFGTKDFVFAVKTRMAMAKVEYIGGPMYISYSVDSGVTWSSEETLGHRSEWGEGMMELNLTCTTIRFKLRSTATDVRVRWIIPWYIDRKRSE